MARNADDTVILRPARAKRSWPSMVLGAVVLVVAMGFGTAWLYRPPPPVPAPTIPMASEVAIQAESPAALTVLRFDYNPSIIVLDFPTLAEQGRMLNRLAALIEKAGVPHDRLLNDTELAAAILASGATADTYYYGHDYRAADVARFFAYAGRDHVLLNADEQHLGRIVARAASEPFGFGAVISLPRADADNQVDIPSRIAILHHELSHGEYFTNATYAGFVRTIWSSVLTEPERAAFRAYLADEGYDPALEDLMTNEMQAYLMHTPDRRFFDPDKLGISAARLDQIRQSFVAGMPSCWLRDVTSATPGVLPARAPRRRRSRVSAPGACPGRRRSRPRYPRAGAGPRSRSAATPGRQPAVGSLAARG